MTIPLAALHVFCPMHVALDRFGHIKQAGATLHKLGVPQLEGRRFLDVFEVYRPRAVDCMTQLLRTEGRKLHLRLRSGKRTSLKGHLVPDGTGGAAINLSFGIAVIDAVRDYALTSADFAPTDLAVEMLYLVEAKSAAMDASRRLNTRLQGAMLDAEERAFTDTLTGLRNRRAMDHVLTRLGRAEAPFALMHLDLDFFKQVNDTMGHAAGDYVLQNVARIMLDETRKDDTAARVGGDEFVIVMSNSVSCERLSDLAQRLIARISKPVLFDGRECRVSASVGISQSDGTHTDPATILEEADIALYAAKRAGRARFAFYQAGPAEITSMPQNAAAGE